MKVFEISDSFIKYKELQLDLSCGHLPWEKLNEKKKKKDPLLKDHYLNLTNPKPSYFYAQVL